MVTPNLLLIAPILEANGNFSFESNEDGIQENNTNFEVLELGLQLGTSKTTNLN